MRLSARLCFAVGIAAAAAGIGSALTPLIKAVSAKRPLFRASIQLGEAAASHWLNADASALRTGLSIKITPRFATQEMRRDGAGEQVALYRFPLHYRVRDESGNMLIDQWVLIDASENRTLSRNYSERLEVTPVIVNATFDPFPTTQAKRVRIEALLLPDRVYSADLEQAELRLFRQLPPAVGAIRLGLAGIFSGLALMLFGLLAELLPAAAVSAVRPATAAASVRVFAFRPRAKPQPILAPEFAAQRRAL